MDIKHKLETEEGEVEVYMKASIDDVDYLQRLSLTYLIDLDMFPFSLLSEKDACKFHKMPELTQ